MLKYRILTAALLIPLVFASIFYTSFLTFQLILASILLLAGWEWTALSRINHTGLRILYLSLLGLCFYLFFSLKLSIIFLSVFWWFWVFYQMATQKFSRFFDIKNSIFVASIGVLIFTSCFMAISFLRLQNQRWVVILLLIVWIADIAAYFAGRAFGRHLLASKISPKKTWEGAYGALIAVFISILLMGWLGGLQIVNLLCLAFLGSCTVIISIVGDLFESLLKRKVGVKDSGQLLPGHGGILDRIDSLLAAAPFFVFGALVLKLF
jgi:phosphatidate cytidylyltransferase